MNLSIKTDQEDDDSISKRVAEHNAETGDNLNDSEFCAKVLREKVNSWKADDYRSAVQRLGEAAAKLPYEERKALIAQVEAATQ